MLTLEYQKILGYDFDGKPIYQVHGFCLSSDSKPTDGIGNGSDIIEIDTSKIYFYDQSGKSWHEWEA